MQEVNEKPPADLPYEETSSNLQKLEHPENVEPEVLIKREKYTIFHMLRNVLIYVLILGILYICLPFEIITVASSSMQPSLPVGSVSIAIKADEDTEYHVGDIITFAVEYGGTYYSRITHRIVAIDGDTIQTKGDNNPDVDPFTINKSQIRNVVKWKNIFKI